MYDDLIYANEDSKFEMKTAIIIGGGRGIGAGLSKAFYDFGYFTVIASRSSSNLISLLGARAAFIECDVRFEDQVRKVGEKAVEQTGKIDAWINCAGFSGWNPVQEVDENFWDQMIDTNLKGTFWGCKVAVQFMHKGGSIINISSLAGKRGSANNSVYCASKFGVNGITQALAKELGPQGIRVNSVCPVYIETKGLKEALQDSDSPAGGMPVKEYLKQFTKQNSALGRMPTAAEVADLCLFLASPNASAITGQCINVDCGVLPQ